MDRVTGSRGCDWWETQLAAGELIMTRYFDPQSILVFPNDARAF